MKRITVYFLVTILVLGAIIIAPQLISKTSPPENFLFSNQIWEEAVYIRSGTLGRIKGEIPIDPERTNNVSLGLLWMAKNAWLSALTDNYQQQWHLFVIEDVAEDVLVSSPINGYLETISILGVDTLSLYHGRKAVAHLFLRADSSQILAEPHKKQARKLLLREDEAFNRIAIATYIYIAVPAYNSITTPKETVWLSIQQQARWWSWKRWW